MAKARTGSGSTKTGARSGKKKGRGQDEPRLIDGADSVIVVQFSEPDPVPPGDIETFVASVIGDVLSATKARPSTDTSWMFFLATERQHSIGLHCWLGVVGVPSKIVDSIQAAMVAYGCKTSREHAIIAHHSLRPLITLTNEGVEVPASASSPADEALDRLSHAISRRPFIIDLDQVLKKDLLGATILGDKAPAFRLRYFHDDPLATFVFGRVDLQMFAQQGDGSVTAMTKLTTAPPCVLSFDFLRPQLIQLVELLPSDVGERLLELLSAGRPFRVPSGTVIVGVLAHAAPSEPNESTPFVAEGFVPARGTALSVLF